MIPQETIADENDASAPTPALEGADLEWFRAFIYRQAGIHFKPEKAVMLTARLSRRLRQLGLASFADYRRYLQKSDGDGRERGLLVNCITTNKTEFFREAHHFAYLRDELFPRLLARAAAGGPRRLRIWSAGCSTGEEPYSLAITLREHFAHPGWQVGIVASDIDTQVLATAAAGVYPEDRLRPVPDEVRRRHFQRGTRGSAGLWRARPELKQLIDFRRINLNEEDGWPTRERFDAIFCRNVIIYFDRPTQIRLFERFAQQLDDDGLLFLGHSESLIGITERFTLIGKTVHALRPGPLASDTGQAPRPLARKPAPLPLRRSPVPRAAARGSVAQPSERILVGEVHASRAPVVVHTLLGSCVAAGLFDPQAGVGGLNHFLLASGEDDDPRSARYGVHAMELLINEIMKLGGQRERLRAKIFGGAHVMAEMSGIVPEQNVSFVRRFLAVEGIALVGERVGGSSGMEVWFHTATGRARVRNLRALPKTMAAQVAAERARLARQLELPADARITVF